MTEQVSDSGVAKIGHSIMTALGGLLTWLTAGWSGAMSAALAALLSLVGAICSLVFSVGYARYLGILGAGAEPEGSPERKTYDDLRDSRAVGNRAGRFYVDWLTRFLDAVDRLLGDADKAARTLLPHAFGLTKPAPLWTAASFKCCLLLALIYPIVTIFMIWTVSGHVGPAEAALGLKSDLPGWSRGFMAAAVAFQGFAIWRFLRTAGWISFGWLAATFAVASAFVAFGAVAGASPFAGAVMAQPRPKGDVGRFRSHFRLRMNCGLDLLTEPTSPISLHLERPVGTFQNAAGLHAAFKVAEMI